MAKTSEVKLPAADRGTVFFLMMTEIYIRPSRVKNGVTFSQMINMEWSAVHIIKGERLGALYGIVTVITNSDQKFW